MNIYVMRHGRTNYNELELCNDDPNADVHLNAIGKQQAQAAAEQLRDVTIDRIIVSPLPRTRQTAEFVNQYHEAPIEVHPDISDIRTGFDGKAVDEYFAAIAHDPLNARVNGGESVLDHKRRVLGFIHWLQQQHQENILIVAHEDTLRVFVAHFESDVPDERLRDLTIGNCEYRCYKLGESSNN
ncbi:MAG: histidine phosphatase family protein [Gammaproteobacteria bacterium]